MISDGVVLEDKVVAKVQADVMFKHLSDRDRQILNLFIIQGKTQREIATMMGLSQSYISRIIKGVRKKYGS